MIRYIKAKLAYWKVKLTDINYLKVVSLERENKSLKSKVSRQDHTIRVLKLKVYNLSNTRGD